ncbi:MAG TPA: monovalent cation/H+ antiporter complex subunit F [Gaiellaceae bacterium]|nr:monovalent cation/H+ antiporter complex subunit F [Gaiellaceae bacterium]
MNVWLVAATVLLAGLVPCGWVLLRATALDGLVALELVTTLVTLVLVLLAAGFHRSSYYTLPLVLAGLGFVGTMVFVRFLGGRWL